MIATTRGKFVELPELELELDELLELELDELLEELEELELDDELELDELELDELDELLDELEDVGVVFAPPQALSSMAVLQSSKLPAS